MKQLLTLFFLAGALSQAKASPYPPEAYIVKLNILNHGPMLVAQAANVFGSKTVIGYKNSGSLAAYRPQKIDAVVTYSCAYNNQISSNVFSIELGREWNQAGWMSWEHSLGQGVSLKCDPEATYFYKVAFSDRKGNWDNNNGQDYPFQNSDFHSATSISSSFSQGLYPSMISPAAWSFIMEYFKR